MAGVIVLVGGNRDRSSISGKHAFYGIGLAFAFASSGDITDPYDKGLKSNSANVLPKEDGTGELIQLSNAQTIPITGDNAFVLTLGTDKSYSYSINGATATSGTIVDGGTFDLSKEFYFNAYSQAGTTTISEILLETTSSATPEPSSYALMLLGLCGLVIISRRQNSMRVQNS